MFPTHAPPMRLVTYTHLHQYCLGVVDGDSVILPALIDGCPNELKDMLTVIGDGPKALEKLAELVEDPPFVARFPLEPVLLEAPIQRPHKNVMCLGWNYKDHVEESAQATGKAQELPEHPVVFTKSASSINGPHANIPFDPDISTEMDWEVELGVVIGKRGHKIPPEDALNHVFGYTVINDISARDLQFRHQQFFIGKSLDGACPMGPWVVTADEIPDPQALDLRCKVNGEIKQDSNTKHQIFDIPTTISILSQSMTLEPGDIIATGTPSGVGFARNPPEFLKPGDIVECEIESIGQLKNRIIERSGLGIVMQ